MPAALRAVLVITRDHHTERRELSGGTLVIGSGPGASLHVTGAAPLHAVLDAGADGFFLLDLAGSTTVNGAAIHRAPIALGDVIAIGEARLVLEKPPAPAPAPRASPSPAFLAPSSGRGALEVAQLWGDSLVGLSHVRAPQPITLGESAGCSFFVPAELLPRDGFPLVTYRAGEPLVHVPRGAAGYVERAGERLPLAAWLARGSAGESAGAEIPLAPGERLRLDVAPGLSLLLQRVDRTVPIGPPGLDALDLRFVGVFASLAAGFLMLGLLAKLIALLGLFAPAVTDDLVRAPTATAILALPMEEIEKIEKSMLRTKHDPDAGQPNAGAGERMRGEEGTRGDPDSKIAQARGSATKLPSDRPVDVRNYGALAAFRDSGLDVPAIFGQGDRGSPMDVTLGQLQGPERHADANGSRGWSFKGKEKGGGGRSLTIDGDGTKGRIQRGRHGDGNLPGSPGKRECATCFTVDTEEVRTMGYPPDWIDAVIKRHVGPIQACYEQRLIQLPTLSGKVLMKFTIASDGTVSDAGVDPSSTLFDAAVSKCLVARFKPLRFPPPPSKGTVGVRYPLLFKTAGQ